MCRELCKEVSRCTPASVQTSQLNPILSSTRFLESKKFMIERFQQQQQAQQGSGGGGGFM